MEGLISCVPGSSVMILPATWRDLNAIRHLEKLCFPKDVWPIWDIIGVLTLPNVVRLKAEVNQRIIGFVAADIRSNQNLFWIATIGVLPEFRAQGIGSALLQSCEQSVNMPIGRLSVRASNKAAIRLYQRFGYQKVGTWQRYYHDGENALVLEKRFST